MARPYHKLASSHGEHWPRHDAPIMQAL